MEDETTRDDACKNGGWEIGVRRDQERSGETKGGNAGSEWRLSGNEKDWKSNERMRNKRNRTRGTEGRAAVGAGELQHLK